MATPRRDLGPAILGSDDLRPRRLCLCPAGVRLLHRRLGGRAVSVLRWWAAAGCGRTDHLHRLVTPPAPSVPRSPARQLASGGRARAAVRRRPVLPHPVRVRVAGAGLGAAGDVADRRFVRGGVLPRVRADPAGGLVPARCRGRWRGRAVRGLSRRLRHGVVEMVFLLGLGVVYTVGNCRRTRRRDRRPSLVSGLLRAVVWLSPLVASARAG